MSIGLLTDNLIELYVEGHRLKSSESFQMIANLRGTHLYTEASWLGKIWKWFYKITTYLKFFRPEYADLKEQKLLAAIQHTQDIFYKNYQQVVNAQIVYHKSLEERCHLKNINEGSVHEARSIFRNWHEATSQWFDFMKEKKSKAITDWIEHTLDKGRYKGPFSPVDAKIPDPFGITCKMVALEGYLQESLPVEVLLKLACDQPLDKIEKEITQKFVKKVNKLKGAFSIKDFDDILKMLVDYYNKTKENPQIQPRSRHSRTCFNH